VFCQGKWYIVTPFRGFVLQKTQLQPALLWGATAGNSIAPSQLWVPQPELGS